MGQNRSPVDEISDRIKYRNYLDQPYSRKKYLDLMSEEKNGGILTIDDYVKEVIIYHQDKQTDQKIAQKLGISRKTLWEKRKKYGLEKKKTS